MACAPPHSPIQQRVQSQRFDFVQLFLLHGRNGGVLAAGYVQFQGKVGSSRSQVEGRYEHIRHDAGVRADTRDVRLRRTAKVCPISRCWNDPASNDQPGMSTGLRSNIGSPAVPVLPGVVPQHREIGTVGLRDGSDITRGNARTGSCRICVGSASYLPPIWLLLAFYLARIWRLYPLHFAHAIKKLNEI